ncbi:MAG: penicillin acylase family protein [Bacteroidota bacterium]
MKTVKRILAIVLVVVVLALAAGMIFLNNLKTRAVPDYNRDVDLENLTEEVTVFRDSLGIPHIYAANEQDLYRTVGYVMAQDRLWQMDLMRRITTGRLAEVLDPGLVGADQLFRALQFSKKSELVISKTDPEILACLEAFSDGVNQYIGQHQKRLPFEFTMLGYKPEPWELVHTFNLIGYMHWDLASGWKDDMALYKLRKVLDEACFKELIPDKDHQPSWVYPDDMASKEPLELQSNMDDAIGIVEELGLQVFLASNNWAVSGTRSKTGMPMLANDMHLGLMAPGIWYQIHQVVEGSVNVTGVALPGCPYVIAGHNEDIGWGWTNLYVDDTDFYLETIHPGDSNQYRLDGQWKEMEVIEESIRVKGEENPVTRVNRFTHRGPVVSKFKDVNDRIISMRWTGTQYSNEMRAVHLLNRASNWDEFREAVSTFYVGQNGVYADRFGNIGLQTVAAVPIRPEGDGISIYPGDTSRYDWTGQVPFDQLPNSFNPECGYVSSANNRTVGDDYPYYIGTWYDLPYRVERIREMLDEQELHGADDFGRMIRDPKSLLAQKLTPAWLVALKEHTEGVYRSAYELLEQWDYNMEAGSPAAMIFDVMWFELHKTMFRDELEKELYLQLLGSNSISWNLMNRVGITGESAWCDDITTPGIRETYHDNIRTAFHQTVDTISVMFGEDPQSWQWRELHQVSLMHPLGSVDIVERIFKVNRGPYPVGGSFHTVYRYSYPIGQSYISKFGAAQRHIFNTANWDRSLTVIPTGNSGVPASPHYMDQTELYLNNQFHRDHFSREAVEANRKYQALYK